MAMAEGLRKRRAKQSTKLTSEEPPVQKKQDEDAAFRPTEPEWETGTYWMTRVQCLRAVCSVYFVAFLVALHQNHALIGKEGILPVSNHLRLYRSHFGDGIANLMAHCPTLLWLVPTGEIDWWLDAMACAGLVISGIVVYVGGANIFMMLALWILYHSITNVGQTWYGFGWESQILETGFLAIFLCPVFTVKAFPVNTPPSWVVVLAYRWLLFRIMLGAGLIKIRGDKCWRDLTCMDYHYQTQPVPNPLSYYLHQSPKFIHWAETAGNHVVELVIPFFLFWPRTLRKIGGIAQILFQTILILSGNLSFLNWLTMIPAICCFDDVSLRWMFSKKSQEELQRTVHLHKISEIHKGWGIGEKFRKSVDLFLFCLIAYLSLPVVNNMLSKRQAMNRSFDSLRIVNTYGAFGSVTKTRTEVILQGTHSTNPSAPGAVWMEYEFKCKPGNVTRRPCIISPYHYRLDWLMWFAAFQDAQSNPWFISLVSKLLVNDRSVTALIDKNPFKEGPPPKFIRAEHYKYTYTKIGSAAAKAGKWWKRRRIGPYLPPVNLDSLKQYLNSRGFKVPRLT